MTEVGFAGDAGRLVRARGLRTGRVWSAVLITGTLGVFTLVVAWPISPAGVLRLIAAVTYLLAGAVALIRWPTNRTGLWMIASSVGLFVEAIFWGWGPVKGFHALDDVSTPLILTMGLAFPSGRLTRAAFGLAATEWVLAVGEPLLRQVGVVDGRFRTGADVAEAVLCVAVVVLLARRFRVASPPLRRALGPGYLVGAATLAVGVAIVFADLDSAQRVHDLLVIAFGVLRAALPVSFLIGLLGLRRDGAAADLVTQLVAPGSDTSLDALVRRTLGDPTARVLTGPESTATDPSGRAGVTPELAPISFDGTVVGVLQHDPGVDEFAVRSVAAAVGLALHNARMREDVARRTAELTEAAGRLVEATDIARRQVERNLHDGAQQRLVAVGVQLRLLQQDLDSSGAAAAAGAVGRIAENLSDALSELRTLASGMQPAVLTHGGLIPALHTLAAASPLQVSVDLDQATELAPLTAAGMATLYYAAAEGLTNATKHSDADRVRVELRTGGDRVSVAVTDDGRGGVDQTGAGISGIRDRAQLLGGDVEVVEVPGGGTRFLAWVPLPAGQAGAAARPTSPSVGQ